MFLSLSILGAALAIAQVPADATEPPCQSRVTLQVRNESGESAGSVASYLAEQRCVYYAWSVEEHWSRTVTETYRDSKGHTRTRTRHESGSHSPCCPWCGPRERRHDLAGTGCPQGSPYSASSS